MDTGSPWKALADDNRRQILLILKKKDMIPTEIVNTLTLLYISEFYSPTDFEGCEFINREKEEKTDFTH